MVLRPLTSERFGLESGHDNPVQRGADQLQRDAVELGLGGEGAAELREGSGSFEAVEAGLLVGDQGAHKSPDPVHTGRREDQLARAELSLDGLEVVQVEVIQQAAILEGSTTGEHRPASAAGEVVVEELGGPAGAL